MEHGRKSYKIVYTIVERARDRKKFWIRVGAAFTNRDGSLNVHLDAIPTNGTLQIRDARALDGSGREADASADALAAGYADEPLQAAS